MVYFLLRYRSQLFFANFTRDLIVLRRSELVHVAVSGVNERYSNQLVFMLGSPSKTMFS
jgi:hypothetical protein